MPEIPLSNGLVAIVDDEDYERVAAVRWHASKGPHTHYARANRPAITMHRFILQPPPGQPVDHANGNGLDNRRSNIRIATAKLNSANSRRRRGPTGYRGVNQIADLFRASITVDGRRIYLGRFANAEDAAEAYDEAARKFFGPFARLNFQDKSPTEIVRLEERAAIARWLRRSFGAVPHIAHLADCIEAGEYHKETP